MAAFWDARAREDAAFFVDNRRAYGDADLAGLWEDGEHTLDTLLDLLGVGLRAEDHLVEIGCGIGRLTRALASRVARVSAVDVSEEMLARARAHHPGLGNVDWVRGDGRTLAAVPDATADGILSHVVFQHLPDPALTLGYVSEMGRVLRPGGWAGFQLSTDPAVHAPREPRGAALRRRALGRLGRAPRGVDHPAWLGSAVDPGALRRAAGEAGLAVELLSGEGTQFTLARLRRAR